MAKQSPFRAGCMAKQSRQGITRLEGERAREPVFSYGITRRFSPVSSHPPARLAIVSPSKKNSINPLFRAYCAAFYYKLNWRASVPASRYSPCVNAKPFSSFLMR